MWFECVSCEMIFPIYECHDTVNYPEEAWECWDCWDDGVREHNMEWEDIYCPDDEED